MLAAEPSTTEIWRDCEIWENERYSPLFNFSSKGLLPSDRGHYSVGDGTLSWSTLQEAEADLISMGWEWEKDESIRSSESSLADGTGNEKEQSGEWRAVVPASNGGSWRVTTSPTTSSASMNANPSPPSSPSSRVSITKLDRNSLYIVGNGGENVSGGWVYAHDFTHIAESFTTNKELTSFVRRRRLVRRQYFNPRVYFDANSLHNDFLRQCTYCDKEKVESLSLLLLHSLSASSSLKYPRHLNEAKINGLKTSLMQCLCLGDAVGPDSNISDLRSVERVLEDFARKGQDGLSFLSAALSSQDKAESLSKRVHEISTTFFQESERVELAKLLIRKLDRTYDFHCDAINCEENGTCLFRTVRCTNPDCPDSFSAKWTEKHDSRCTYKVVNCDRMCGECVPRRLMQEHLLINCTLRPVVCPYEGLGCKSGGSNLVFKTLEEHLVTHTQYHLQLSVLRLEEQQSVIIQLHKRMTALEDSHMKHATEIAATTATVSTSLAAIEALRTKHTSTASTHSSALDALKRKVDATASTVVSNTSAIETLKRQTSSLTASCTNTATAIEALQRGAKK